MNYTRILSERFIKLVVQINYSTSYSIDNTVLSCYFCLKMWLESVWNCGWFLAVMFVFLNLVVQVAAAFCVMSRTKVKEACYALFFIIAMQTVGYSILWDPKFLAR